MDESASALKRLKKLVAPHVDSFNYFVGEGLRRVLEGLPPLEIESEGRPLVTVWLQELELRKPTREDTRSRASREAELRIFPRECRQAGGTYSGALTGRVCWQTDGSSPGSKDLRIASLPVMVRRRQPQAACIALRGALAAAAGLASTFVLRLVQPLTIPCTDAGRLAQLPAI